MTSSHDKTNRKQQIDSIVGKCRDRLRSGKDIPEELIGEKFSHLQPELGRELDKMRRVEHARRQATPAGETATLAAPATPRPGSPVPPVRSKVRYFGDYELLEEVARGGMGVVYKARQVSLNRVVAVKMILAGNLASQQDLQRFYAEAEAAANLDHPNIVPVYEVGQHAGQHYFSMALVAGSNLDQLLAKQSVSPRKAAEYTRKLAEAVEYAHQQGVLHRDLKPSNVLVDRFDEPKLTDFGLAKRSGSSSDITETGQVLGTPSYMPPEQATGDRDSVGPRSDVYSLGAILYTLLTGRPPCHSDNPAHTLIQVASEAPAPPRSRNKAVDRDLETICLKCLEKQPEQRYQSAGQLADDLQRYLQGHSIIARPTGVASRAWRWCQRNAAMVAMSVVLLAALLFAAYSQFSGPKDVARRAESRDRTINGHWFARQLTVQLGCADDKLIWSFEGRRYVKGANVDQSPLYRAELQDQLSYFQDAGILPQAILLKFYLNDRISEVPWVVGAQYKRLEAAVHEASSIGFKHFLISYGEPELDSYEEFYIDGYIPPQSTSNSRRYRIKLEQSAPDAKQEIYLNENPVADLDELRKQIATLLPREQDSENVQIRNVAFFQGDEDYELTPEVVLVCDWETSLRSFLDVLRAVTYVDADPAKGRYRRELFAFNAQIEEEVVLDDFEEEQLEKLDIDQEVTERFEPVQTESVTDTEVIDVSPIDHAAAAPVAVEVSDFGMQTATRNDLMQSVGSPRTSGVPGRQIQDLIAYNRDTEMKFFRGQEQQVAEQVGKGTLIVYFANGSDRDIDFASQMAEIANRKYRAGIDVADLRDALGRGRIKSHFERVTLFVLRRPDKLENIR